MNDSDLDNDIDITHEILQEEKKAAEYWKQYFEYRLKAKESEHKATKVVVICIVTGVILMMIAGMCMEYLSRNH